MGRAVGALYLRHLLKDYNPLAKGEMPRIWRDQMGERLTNPDVRERLEGLAGDKNLAKYIL